MTILATYTTRHYRYRMSRLMAINLEIAQHTAQSDAMGYPSPKITLPMGDPDPIYYVVP